MLYAIFYRVGGSRNGQWLRVFGLFSVGEAETRRQALERMGYPVRLCCSTSVLAAR